MSVHTLLAPKIVVVPGDVIVADPVPIEGANELLNGYSSNTSPPIVMFVVLVTVPPGVVTEMAPVVAPTGILAVICVAEFTVKLVALVPLKLTVVAPVKSVPVITTGEPIAPDVGVNDEIVGGGMTVKLEELVTVPPGVVIEMVPVETPEGTVAVICVAELTVKLVASVPLNRTAVALVKFVPVSVTVVPDTPLEGVKEEIVGGGITV